MLNTFSSSFHHHETPVFSPPEFSLPEAEAGGAGARGESIVIPLAIKSYINDGD
jgi:hypothetical protein